MTDLLRSIIAIPVPFNMIILIALILGFVGILDSVAKQIRKYSCHRQDIDFKRELVDRGLPANEIERIMAAQSASGGDKPSSVHCQQYVAGGD